jgi:hypothetical protein
MKTDWRRRHKSGFRLLLLTSALGLCFPAWSAVVINEFMAAASDGSLYRDVRGVPHPGSGAQWTDPDFRVAGWNELTLPAGYGFSNLATDLASRMRDKAPSVYLRKEFQVASAQAASAEDLILAVQCNDGFVAYLNGREAARWNCGPPGSFVFAAQPAFNASTNGTNFVEFSLGPAADWLVSATNVLAIQAHNADRPSTTSSPEQISLHVQTSEFLIDAGLRLGGLTNAPEGWSLVAPGRDGGPWQSFVGRAEPSGGLVDPGLATRAFIPPVGEEDDYEQRAGFADWVELRNDGPSAVNLGGWSLSDDPATPDRWRFPANTVIEAGGFLLVLCDDRDEANAPAGPANYLHANFKLSRSGEFLGLFDSQGRTVDSLPWGYAPQVATCSYGRHPGNPATFVFLPTATPGGPNSGGFHPAQVAPPRFLNHAGEPLPGGIYHTQSLTLVLAPATVGSRIRYTLDGSEPTETNGFAFLDEITLTQPLEKTGVVVRARAFVPGWLRSAIETHSYLLRQPAALTNAPALMLTGEAGRTFYAPEGVLAISGGRFVSVGNGSIWLAGGPRSYNYVIGRGPAFERAAQLEFFPPAGYDTGCRQPLRAEIGLRVSASSWQRPRMRLGNPAGSSPWPVSDTTQKPSFNVHFGGDYGAGKVDYALFPGSPALEFQQLRLRAGKNDNLNPFITDEFVRRLWLDMGHVGARGLFCSLYVNAAYKGLYNVCDRIREPFFQARYHSTAPWDVNYIHDWVDGDGAAYQQLLTSLDRNLTNLVNWRAVADKLDIDNAADYYLLNIYCSMWDWPQNNFAFARERSSGPNSRFRFVIWDAEGAFNVIRYGKAASYNTLTQDLLVPSGSSMASQPVTRIFRRLATSPEFRLRFADRIQHLFFNQGVLDDRDPDGAGPRASHFRRRLDEMVREAGGLVRYNSGQTLSQTAFTAWTSATNGRRAYLLGGATGRRMFRDAGFWPVTEPPVFSQHGGVVPDGFALSITSSVAVAGQTATIYLTLDGNDPRLPGGDLIPTARAYTEPVFVPQVETVKARARNDQTGEWSPLTEARFVRAPAPPSRDNLVVAEVMYHPPGPSAAELAAGFEDPDQFEFIRLLNIGPNPVDLAGMRFSQGGAFEFGDSAALYLGSGANALVVGNRAAFRMRYGSGLDSLIAGEYAGNLANGGERIQLATSNNVVVRDFIYQDSPPWPASADGSGPSLVLRDPFANPDHGNPENWGPSAVPGGLPNGRAPSWSFAEWRTRFWEATSAADDSVSGPEADPDADGLANFQEYAWGLDPHRASSRPRITAGIRWMDGEPRLVLGARLAAGALDAAPEWETSRDLAIWYPHSTVRFHEAAPSPDGTVLVSFIEAEPPGEAGKRFIRLSMRRAH